MGNTLRDWVDVTIFPLQDQQQSVPLGMRLQMAGCRISDLMDPSKTEDPEECTPKIATEFGMGTIGDLHPYVYWQTRGRDKFRATGSWSPSFISLVTGGGKQKKSGGRNLKLSLVSPLWGGKQYIPDGRYIPKSPNWPDCLGGALPRGTIVTTHAGTFEKRQIDFIAHTDPRLVAPWAEGPDVMGTLVVDLQPEAELCMDNPLEAGKEGRAALLQSLIKVAPLDEKSLEVLTTSGKNALAWNCASSTKQGNILGGMVWLEMDREGATTGGNGKKQRQAITPGQSANSRISSPPPSSSPSGGSEQQNSDDQISKSLRGNDKKDSSNEMSNSHTSSGRKTKSSGPCGFGHWEEEQEKDHGYAMMQHKRAFGPFHGGSGVFDQHLIGFDRDDHPVVSGHIKTGAFFHASKKYDAPMLFESIPYPKVKEFQIKVRVHLQYAGSDSHQTALGGGSGMWKWWSTTNVVSPEKEPPDTPTTPGGGGKTGVPSTPSTPGTPTTGSPGTPSTPTPGGGATTGGPGRGSRSRSTPGGGGGGQRQAITPDKRPTVTGPGPGRGPTTGGNPGLGRGWVRTKTPPVDPPGGLIKIHERKVWEDKKAQEVFKIGYQSGVKSAYALHHPTMESFNSISFRPELHVIDQISHRNSGSYDQEEAFKAEQLAPQTLVIDAFGGTNLAGHHNYNESPESSYARGGTADGGILLHPPHLTLDDYFSFNSTKTVTDLITTGYMVLAPGVSFALGTPRIGGGLNAKSIVITQLAPGLNPNTPLVVQQLDSARAATDILLIELDQNTGERQVVIYGNEHITIPRGTTAQRSSAFSLAGGEIRINTNVSAGVDILEFYDNQASTWKQLGSGGGASTFVALTDTPPNYTGAGSKAVKVNSGATALEYIDLDTLYRTQTILASVSNAEGASLIGIQDAATIYAAANVEAALAEVKVIADAASTITDHGALTGLGDDDHPHYSLVVDLASISAGEGASLIGIQDSATIYAASTVEAALAEVKVIADAASTVTTFVGLTDTPPNFTGAGSKAVKVNSGATALEYIDLDTLYRTQTVLSSESNAEGASLIGIEDALGIMVATEVEAALLEIIILDLAYMPLFGATFVGNVIWNDNKKILLGTSGVDAGIYSDGTDLIIDALAGADVRFKIAGVDKMVLLSNGTFDVVGAFSAGSIVSDDTIEAAGDFINNGTPGSTFADGGEIIFIDGDSNQHTVTIRGGIITGWSII